MTENKPNKTISRAEGIITNKIWDLERKIENVKERWPEDMYGLKYLEKTDKYEQEIKELREYLNSKQSISAMLKQSKEKQKEVFRSKMLMNDIKKTLIGYGEYNLADRLEREMKSIE